MSYRLAGINHQAWFLERRHRGDDATPTCASGDAERRYLRDLIHRLEAIEAFILDLNRPEDAYQFRYRGDDFDWRSILSDTNAYC